MSACENINLINHHSTWQVVQRITSLINVVTCVQFEKDEADVQVTNTAKRQRRFKEKVDKRRCDSNVVLNVVVQQMLRNENPPLQHHDENGRPVEKNLLPSVAD